MDYTKYQQMIYYLETLEYPSQSTSQQNKYLRLHFKHYFTKDQKLYRKSPTRLVLLSQDARNSFQMYHNHPLGGHYAFQNTYLKIAKKYYWEGMIKDIREWVSSCTRCQQKGKEIELEKPHVVPVPLEPFQQVAMDIKHVQTSRGGYRYIIVAINYFSKWTEARALVNANSVEVFNFFVDEVMTRHSVTRILITDNGSPFSNLLINTLCHQFGIKHKYSSAYHPQGNGLVERFNRTLGSCLKKPTPEEKPDWHLYLTSNLFSYRCITQASTRLTPFKILYGRTPCTPFDNKLRDIIDEEEPMEDEDICRNFEIIKSHIQTIHELARENIKKAQES